MILKTISSGKNVLKLYWTIQLGNSFGTDSTFSLSCPFSLTFNVERRCKEVAKKCLGQNRNFSEKEGGPPPLWEAPLV